MSRRRRKPRLPSEPVSCTIESLSHEGRGVARIEGKTAFVDGALPGETVSARYVEQHRRFDALRTLEVTDTPSGERVTPPCAHADICGGCSLQHMDPQAQIAFKESVLREQFDHFGQIEPGVMVPPMVDQPLGYRRKARLGVRYVYKREEVLVGFREKRNPFITAIDSCVVLDPRVGERITGLKALVGSLTVYQDIAQIEVACGDDDAALVFRHMKPLGEGDEQRLTDFGREHGLQIYLQPKGPDTVHRIWPRSGDGPDRLYYRLPAFGLTMAFHPMDFTQVNGPINRRMLDQALEWLQIGPRDRVLDLFCGLGNFSLPMATQAREVVAVEGDEAMVLRGRENAETNGIGNCHFHSADLQADFSAQSWAGEGFSRMLIDPPRSGALEVVQRMAESGAERIVYVSCNPATLARDAGELVQRGYRLEKAGVMDMFPHTTHVESMALFVRDPQARRQTPKKPIKQGWN
ncbi:MAG: 23S rRNA (uracil(1939)-C(5))-methyltransferase RlmD [Oleiphilaceae bacterium]|nr:23S rRNA (uracil(1939)-C(5))-methyltransferase RlmD [Oleiphilaceae bacterium]